MSLTIREAAKLVLRAYRAKTGEPLRDLYGHHTEECLSCFPVLFRDRNTIVQVNRGRVRDYRVLLTYDLRTDCLLLGITDYLAEQIFSYVGESRMMLQAMARGRGLLIGPDALVEKYYPHRPVPLPPRLARSARPSRPSSPCTNV